MLIHKLKNSFIAKASGAFFFSAQQSVTNTIITTKKNHLTRPLIN